MAEIVHVAVSDLLLDQSNARLGEEQASQQAVYAELAAQQGPKLVKLAEDIVANGLDPTTLITIVPTGDRKRRYRVIEGNRRVLALKALETPPLVAHVLSPKDRTTLASLSTVYLADPLTTIQCVLFGAEEETRHWVELRHTGVNEGAGLAPWSSDEQDRFRARHGQGRGPGGQVIDVVKEHGQLSSEARKDLRIVSNVDRLLWSAEAREILGIDKVQGQIISYYPLDKILPALQYIVEEFATRRAKVKDIYEAPDRKAFAEKIPASIRPKGPKLGEPVALEDLAAGRSDPAPAPKRRRRRRNEKQRTTVIPDSCRLDIDPPRINKIYFELLTLDTETYQNAAAVLLRVFVELSVDHALDGVMSEEERGKAPLGKKLTVLGDHLVKTGKISDQVKKTVRVIATKRTGPLAASMMTMNQYVHNPNVHPTPSELRSAWDELQPLMEALWP